MALLDLVLQHNSKLLALESESNKKPSSLSSSKSTKFTSEVARKALNLMIILRPITMVTTLAKEVSSYLACQHVTHYPHSSIQPVQVDYYVYVHISPGIAYTLSPRSLGWYQCAFQHCWDSYIS